MFPLVWLIFRRFFDLGIGLAKTFGLLIISYLAYLGAISHILPLTNIALYSIFIFFALANLFIFSKNKKDIVSDLKSKAKIIILQEILFTLGLIFWSYIRAHQPDIRGLEKFMDFGFINSIIRSNSLPPKDMWLAGSSINYYWFGHFMVAIATKLSQIPSYITYNLDLATIMGLTLTGAFSIITTLIHNLSDQISLKKIKIAGIISAILLVFGGNFHTPYYVWKNGRERYWYPDATRFIGYNPDVNDKTIHEFPMYSFVVSDLHAHLINLPVVLLYLALVFSLLTKFKAKEKEFNFWSLGITGFVLGTMFATNTWDFGTYSLLTGITVGFYYLKNKGLNLEAFWEVTKKMFTIEVVAILIAAPFILNFSSIAQGVKPVHSHSPLWQLAILWGFPAILTVIFSGVIYRFRKSIQTSDIFVASLLFSSWILILLPELIYVKDIYVATHYRANTMFKLTYEAFVMFYLTSGYIFVRSATSIKKNLYRFVFIIFTALIFYSVLIYPSFAIKGYYGDLKVYNGLNGESWLNKQYPGEYAAIDWLRKNVVGQPFIVEAQGDSYTDYNVISAYTGLPTIQGWFVHEWLWRGTSDVPAKTSEDVRIIYTSTDVNLIKELLNKYKVEYIIVGTFEREKYQFLDEDRFAKIGTKVFSSANTTIYEFHNSLLVQ